MLDPKLAKSTKRGYLYSIERWMEYLGISVKFAHKPKGGAKCPNYLDQDQLRELIHAAKDYREFTVLATFIYTGARLNEVRNINLGDIDFAQKHIHIRVAKRDKERIVPLDPALERVLRAYIARLPQGSCKPSSPLITTARGGRISDKWLGEMVKRIGDRIGLHIHPHMLRHSFASAWVENGGDVFNLQVVLGHSDIGMTRRYWHFNDKAMKAAWERGGPKL